jgi:hypothetical protein
LTVSSSLKLHPNSPKPLKQTSQTLGHASWSLPNFNISHTPTLDDSIIVQQVYNLDGLWGRCWLLLLLLWWWWGNRAGAGHRKLPGRPLLLLLHLRWQHVRLVCWLLLLLLLLLLH